MKRTFLSSFAIACVLLPACVVTDESELELGELEAEIANGVPSGNSAVAPISVVRPNDENGNPQEDLLCTGTLIEECTVITAARCVADNVEAGTLVDIDVRFGGNDVSGGTSFPVEFVELGRFFDPDGGSDDIALIRLQAPCPTVTPVEILDRSLTQADVGGAITLVGYGESTAGSGVEGTRYEAEVMITSVNPTQLLAGDAMTTSCAGDSGGPGFIGGKLASVTFRQGSCNHQVPRIRLDQLAERVIWPFIDRYSGACPQDGSCTTAGCRSADPDCDVCAWQGQAGDADCKEDCPTRDLDCTVGTFVGEECAQSGDCEEGGRCVAAVDDATFNYCTLPCDPQASSCPQGMECSTAGGQAECVWTTPSPGSQGFACTGATQCRSGICEGGICVFPCGAGDTCADPYICGDSQQASGMRVCLGEILDGGGGFCAVGGGDSRGVLALLFALGLLPWVLRRRGTV